MEKPLNSIAAFWGPTLENIFNDKVLIDQLEQARKSYPELTSAFELIAAYLGYVQEPLDILRTIPEIDPNVIPPEFRLPDWFCKRAPLMCRCAYGDEKACQVLDGTPKKKYIPKIEPKI